MPYHDNFMICKHFPHYCALVWGIRQWGIHQSPVNSPQKEPVIWHFEFSLLLEWTGCWTNSLLASDLRHHDTHVISVTVMSCYHWPCHNKTQLNHFITLNGITYNLTPKPWYDITEQRLDMTLADNLIYKLICYHVHSMICTNMNPD